MNIEEYRFTRISATTSSLTTAILGSCLLNHLLRETHSFHQLGETNIGAQGIEQEVGLEAR
jgi:hypothetical protein